MGSSPPESTGSSGETVVEVVDVEGSLPPEPRSAPPHAASNTDTTTNGMILLMIL
jgi:hypothetical protein